MSFDPVTLSRIQCGFVVSFHAIFPFSSSVWPRGWRRSTERGWRPAGRAIYRRMFEFWLKVFALSFGMGLVSGIVMAFQFGANRSVLAENTGAIQGPVLG